jgi:hypothetical protein
MPDVECEDEKEGSVRDRIRVERARRAKPHDQIPRHDLLQPDPPVTFSLVLDLGWKAIVKAHPATSSHSSPIADEVGQRRSLRPRYESGPEGDDHRAWSRIDIPDG